MWNNPAFDPFLFFFLQRQQSKLPDRLWQRSDSLKLLDAILWRIRHCPQPNRFKIAFTSVATWQPGRQPVAGRAEWLTIGAQRRESRLLFNVNNTDVWSERRLGAGMCSGEQKERWRVQEAGASALLGRRILKMKGGAWTRGSEERQAEWLLELGVRKQRRDESTSHGCRCHSRNYNEAVQMNDCISSTKTPFQQKGRDQFVTSAWL